MPHWLTAFIVLFGAIHIEAGRQSSTAQPPRRPLLNAPVLTGDASIAGRVTDKDTRGPPLAPWSAPSRQNGHCHKWNGQIAKWRNGRNGEMAKWPNGQMAKWPNETGKWPNGKWSVESM
jgi:hypothetical protein